MDSIIRDIKLLIKVNQNAIEYINGKELTSLNQNLLKYSNDRIQQLEAALKILEE